MCLYIMRRKSQEYELEAVIISTICSLDRSLPRSPGITRNLKPKADVSETETYFHKFLAEEDLSSLVDKVIQYISWQRTISVWI
jgi:hypothetical protein